MQIIYTQDDIDSLSQKLDRDNVSYERLSSALSIKLDDKGSVMLIGTHRSFLIVDNPHLGELNISSLLVNNVLFNIKSLTKHYLMFNINKNHEKIFDNYNDLATVYYQIDYEAKMIKADREDLRNIPDRQEISDREEIEVEE